MTAGMFREEKRKFAATHDYEPFGVEIPPYNESASNSHKFTGHERDATTGYDYMHFRYYGSNIGRFMKPDNVTGSPLNPQNWNLYAYVQNNPVNYNDPTGLFTNHGAKEAQLPSPLGCAWLSNMIGMSGTSWVTTTWQTTINYYGSSGAVSTSVVATWTTTEMYDMSGVKPVPFTFSTDEESIQVVAGPSNADPALSDVANMDVVSNSVKAILMNAPNIDEQLIMLAIGMRESRFGLSRNSANNPTQLSPDSGFSVTGNINENVAHSYSVLEERLRWYPGDLTTAIQRYNGAPDQINYEKRWRMTYENILRTLTHNEAWSKPWP